jgi:energy-coupling factor transporter transmembrane protein EcfT
MTLLYAEVEYPVSEQIFVVVVLFLVTFGLWLLRNTPLRFLWQIYKMFWIVLFATLFIDFFKKEIKEWWNK